MGRNKKKKEVKESKELRKMGVREEDGLVGRVKEEKNGKKVTIGK